MTESLREKVARALYEEPGRARRNWDDYPIHHQEHWLADADRIIPIVAADYTATVAERDKAQRACEEMARRLSGTFICGQSHEKDARGMAMKIHVAPMPGADWFATYTLDNPASDYPLDRPLLSECPDCKSDGAHHPGCPSTEDCPVCGYDCAGADSQPVECPKRAYPKEDRSYDR